MSWQETDLFGIQIVPKRLHSITQETQLYHQREQSKLFDLNTVWLYICIKFQILPKLTEQKGKEDQDINGIQAIPSNQIKV